MTSRPLEVRPRRRRRQQWQRRQSAVGYAWIAPSFAVVGFILLLPVVRAVQYSLTDRTSFLAGQFVGLNNFKYLFTSHLFWLAFRNNVILFISIPVTLVTALVITGILYRGLRGSRLYEFLIFSPFLPAVASIATIFVYALSIQGPIDGMLRNIGAGGVAEPWLTNQTWAIWSVLGVVTWKRLGLTVLLFSARMTGLDRTFFDAASVDGASWSLTYRAVAIPQMRSVIGFAAVLGFIECFSWTFSYIYVLTNGGPDQATYTLEFLLYQDQFVQQLVGLASAIGVVLLIGALVVAAYRVRLLRRELRFG
jgi:ABC-type sugar transport system permease subunit